VDQGGGCCCGVGATCYLLRSKGELHVLHRPRGVRLVLAPPGAPISFIYRSGSNMLKIAETCKTSEWLDLVTFQKSTTPIPSVTAI